MIRTLYFNPQGEFRTNLTPAELPAALQTESGVLWIDFENTPVETDAPILLETFHFHPLAVDDALQESHVPKLDDWGSYLYIVMHAVVFGADIDSGLETLELDIFLGKHYIVTHHDKSIQAIDKMWKHCHSDQRYLHNGPDYFLYRLVDELVAGYMPVVEIMDDEIDLIEENLFNHSTPAILEKLFDLKRAALKLRRILGPQREVLNKLARDDYAVVDSQARVYFRDVYDHLVRLQDISESLRDLLSGTLDTYLSVVNNRMNDIMKTLTVITTLFMPISFVVGFFGMNFFQPEVPLAAWTGYPAFWLTLAIMIGLPALMLIYIRRRGWL